MLYDDTIFNIELHGMCVFACMHAVVVAFCLLIWDSKLERDGTGTFCKSEIGLNEVIAFACSINIRPICGMASKPVLFVCFFADIKRGFPKF